VISAALFVTDPRLRLPSPSSYTPAAEASDGRGTKMLARSDGFSARM